MGLGLAGLPHSGVGAAGVAALPTRSTGDQKICIPSKTVMTATPEMNWELSDIITNAKNVRSAMITDKKGALVTQNIASKTEPLSTPFGASAFNDPTTTRKNLCM